MNLPANSMHRRAFLAAGAVSIPSIALAGGIPTREGGSGSGAQGLEFEELMKEAGRHLKSMRGMMGSLDEPGNRDDASFYANQITILLAQCVMVADQAPIPVRSASEYDGDKERFTKDLRIKLTQAVSSSVALSRQLLLGNDAESISLYNALRTERKEGHDEFQEED